MALLARQKLHCVQDKPVWFACMQPDWPLVCSSNSTQVSLTPSYLAAGVGAALIMEGAHG